MSFRNRPVLDRKHRPRWQDELRTQQLTVFGFAVAIAVALGIFGVASWNGFWEAHLRPVAAVDGTTFNRSDLTRRERIMTAEAVARMTEYQAQIVGGPRDQILQQQFESLGQQLNSITTTAAAAMVDAAVLGTRADEIGITVSDEMVETEIGERLGLPERIWANLILIDPLPEDAEDGAEPTDEQVAAATEEAQGALDRVEGGEEFADVATEVSDDFSSSFGGNIGWFSEDDGSYAEYFDALADAQGGDLIGPIDTDRGPVVLQLVERREATDDGGLRQLLREQGIDDAAYRAYVATDILTDAYQAHFDDEVVETPSEQRRVAQIFIAPVSGEVVPQERARHVLVQPDPELSDQAEATDEQWDAALAEAQEVAGLVAATDADWDAIADEHSDDTGSAVNGGDLGWYDPTNTGFVEPFAAALASMEVGEISDPVRTDFGYHVIQKTGERESPQAQVADIVERLDEDPEAFADIARAESEDRATAAEGGEVGWVARWQLSKPLEDAVFALTEVGDISAPIDEAANGITIYRLLETSDSRDIEDERLAQVRRNGFERWLDEDVRAPVETWVDPQFSSSTNV